MNQEEEHQLLQRFREMGAKPKADSVKDLKRWLNEFHASDVSDEDDDAGYHDVKSVKFSNFPKISTFYGDVDKLTKGEVIFDQWKYEVISMEAEGHKERQILQAIRRSLKGEAARVLKRMKAGSTVEEILKKFESVYGGSDSKATILRNFYSAEQQDKENVREWSCRLEELLDKAIEKGLVAGDNADSMLCDKFWSGMKPELRDITGHKHDTIHDFDTLRSEIKKIEHEYYRSDSKSTSKTVSKSAVRTGSDDKEELTELRSMIKDVASSVRTMSEELQEIKTTVNRQHTTARDDQSFRDTSYRNSGQQSYSSGAFRGRSGSRGRGYRQDRGRTPSSHRESDRQYDRESDRQYDGDRSYRQQSDRGPQCFRCLQYGHYQWQCRVRMDNSRRHHLN